MTYMTPDKWKVLQSRSENQFLSLLLWKVRYMQFHLPSFKIDEKVFQVESWQ